MSLTISHSGGTWTTDTWVKDHKNGDLVPVWPISEYLARTKHGKSVKERIERLNPEGKPEGYRPLGWHPKKKSYRKLKKAWQ